MMLNEIQIIKDAVFQRKTTDRPLINYWLYLFLLSWITFGIYPLILFFQRIGRIDKFIARKRIYYGAVIDYTETHARSTGGYESVAGEIQALKDLFNMTYQRKILPLNAGLSFFYVIITFGIWNWVICYRMNKIWDMLQSFEYAFDQQLSSLWQTLGLKTDGLTFNLVSAKKRNFALYLFLSFITLGIWGIVWDYKMHTDPDDLYPQFHQVEDHILHTMENRSVA